MPREVDWNERYALGDVPWDKGDAAPPLRDWLQEHRVEGRVLVRVLIDKTGVVRKVEVESSSPLFDDAAVEAVRQWTFRPAVESGEPVAAWIRIPIVFRMK